MELRDYLRILRRSWLLIIAFVLLGLAVGAGITVLTTPLYASTTRLFVSTPVGASDINALQGSQFSSDRVASYGNLIKGNAIAEMVIVKLHLTESAADLSDQITANPVTNTVILEVTATDASPARAQQLSQTTAEVFSDYVPTLEGATPAGQSPIKATIVDAAALPTQAVSPKPKLNLALGGLVGLLLGFGVAVLREVLDTTIKTTALLEEITGAATLGTIHYDPLAPKRPLVSQIEATSDRAESFRMLRTNLQFLDVDKQSRIFTLTSPVPGEGKSTTASNLAIILAEAGYNILLLEADLRRPRVADYLSLVREVGLTTVLIGKASLADVVQPWGDHGLEVITSGAIPPNPAELLQSKAMEAVLIEIRQRYDVVIVDSAPLLPVTDAALVASQTDGAILVTRFGKTTRDQAGQAAQRLQAVDAALLGTVLNFAPIRGLAGYGYGYGYSPQRSSTTWRQRRKAAKMASTEAQTDLAVGQAPGLAKEHSDRSNEPPNRASVARPQSVPSHRTASGAVPQSGPALSQEPANPPAGDSKPRP